MAKKIINALTVALSVLLAVTAIVFTVQKMTGQMPSVLGYKLFYVMTGSMEPMLSPQDVIISKEVEASQLRCGDVITFRCESGELAGQLITHKIVDTPVSENGVYRIQTQGIAAGATPDDPIRADQVIGKFVAKLRVVSWLYAVYRTPWGLLLFIVPCGIILIREIYSLFKCVGNKEEDEPYDTDETETGEKDEDDTGK